MDQINLLTIDDYKRALNKLEHLTSRNGALIIFSTWIIAISTIFVGETIGLYFLMFATSLIQILGYVQIIFWKSETLGPFVCQRLALLFLFEERFNRILNDELREELYTVV